MVEKVKEVLKKALEECEKDREQTNPYSRLGHLKGAVMVALNYLALEEMKNGVSERQEEL